MVRLDGESIEVRNVFCFLLGLGCLIGVLILDWFLLALIFSLDLDFFDSIVSLSPSICDLVILLNFLPMFETG